MAIFSHKWLMLWRKKHKFINLSWHGGYGLILSLFEQLEVSVPHNCFITLPGLSEKPVPLEGQTKSSEKSHFRQVENGNLQIVK